MDALALCVVAQTLATLTVAEPGPVRLGLPLPAVALQRGLRAVGPPGVQVQWRLLQTEPGFGSDAVWVEVALLGAAGRVRLCAGGEPSTAAGAAGPVLARTRTAVTDDAGVESITDELRWADGTVDRRERVLDPDDGLAAHTVVSPQWLARTLAAGVPASFWREADVLPRCDGTGTDLRRALIAALPLLDAREADGADGRGDYRRGEVVTNLEFDTALALARLGLAEEHRGCLERAWRSALHLADVDVDRRSGLPFRHGAGHRSAGPEAGHAWIEGLRLCGCLFADDALLETAMHMARSLAQRVRTDSAPSGDWRDRMRDEAWPLFELETHLRFCDIPPVRAAADLLRERMLARWDPQREVLVYGEGVQRGGVHVDRLWLTAGIALPALRLAGERSRDPRIPPIVRSIESRLLALMQQGGSGLPLQYRIGAGGVFGVARVSGAAEGCLLLEGPSPAVRARVLRRAGLRSALDDLLPPDAEDLATRFTLVGRCRWVMG
ncbi:MAG: hypothetical protein IPM29_13505 [Planctomycetes bacterium]|nr:hypothetical protein [Planctomycetota bacterium]